MIDILAACAIAATFLLAGAVKGVIGFGLPTVSLGLLTLLLGIEPAMALMLAPSLATNFWQAIAGGHGRAIAARLWPFLAAATGAIWIGAALASRIDVALLSALLGVLLALYGMIGLVRPAPGVTPATERWAGPAAGALTGVLTGMTGSFMLPGVPYLQALGLPRGALIQAMGMLFTLSTLALGLALTWRGQLGPEIGLASIAAILPAIGGMVLGARLRSRLAEETFRHVVFAALTLLGLIIAATALP